MEVSFQSRTLTKFMDRDHAQTNISCRAGVSAVAIIPAYPHNERNLAVRSSDLDAK